VDVSALKGKSQAVKEKLQRKPIGILLFEIRGSQEEAQPDEFYTEIELIKGNLPSVVTFSGYDIVEIY
jgi:hypothetical protein